MAMDAPNSPAGQQLGKYRIEHELGRGGFATVYAAEDTRLGRRVALKILHPALLADPEFVRRFEADARAAAALEHPNIATILELGQEDGRLFIAQQLLIGGTLEARIAARGALPYAEAVRVTGAIAAALDAAHAAGMVHRDVKPANILFDARDQAVLTDFGLVRSIERSVIGRSSAGGMVGTPAYLAPEIWEGREGGRSVDIYALGCVLFEMLTGKVLFEGETPPAVMRAHFSPRRLPERWPAGVPAGTTAVLEQALDPNPQARFASAGALAAAFASLQPAAASPPASPGPALPTDAAQRQRPEAAPPTSVPPADGAQRQRPQAGPAGASTKRRAWPLILLPVLGLLAVAAIAGSVVLSGSSRLAEGSGTAGPAAATTEPTIAPEPAAAPPVEVPAASEEPAPTPPPIASPGIAASAEPTLAPQPDFVPELVEVPAGPFLMGSTDADTLASNEEKPQHILELPTYWIGKTEITNAQFRPFVEGDGYSNPAYWTAVGWQWREKEGITAPTYWNDPQWNGADQPVVGVSWFEAVAYVRWLSARTGREYRLPSEAEWEKAARGPEGWIWPWGNTWEPGKTNSGAIVGATTPVWQYPDSASPYGALGMAGNAWEWCTTQYEKAYPYQLEDEWAPAYLEVDTVRRIRGGSWDNAQAFVRGAYRGFHGPRNRNSTNGLRVVSYDPQ